MPRSHLPHRGRRALPTRRESRALPVPRADRIRSNPRPLPIIVESLVDLGESLVDLGEVMPEHLEPDDSALLALLLSIIVTSGVRLGGTAELCETASDALERLTAARKD